MIGAGSWGTALAAHLSRCGHKVEVWSILKDETDMINNTHQQSVKLPGVILDSSVTASTDLEQVMRDKDMLVLAVPSAFTRNTARTMSKYCRYGQLIVSVAKGIEEDSLLTLTEVIKQEIPHCEAAVLCGPTHAEEVGIGLPTAIVAGAARKEVAEYIQSVFMGRTFRVYTSPDMLGMQVGAALKNVIALAAGCSDGLGCGDNTKAALITRGIAEISQIGTLMGMTADDAMKEVKQVVEGVFSAKAALQLADKYGVEAPIIRAVNRVLFENEAPDKAVEELMLREGKTESDGIGW